MTLATNEPVSLEVSHSHGPKMVDEDAYICPQQDWQPGDSVATLSCLAESVALLQMDGSTDQFGYNQVVEMDRISFSDGTASCIKRLANLVWGQRDGYPFLVSDQQPCESARLAIKDSGKDYNIPGWCSKIQGLSNQFAFSVLPLYIQNHRKCSVCPSINRIVKVTSEYWLQHRAEATPEFRRFVSAIVSQFYNTRIRVGAGPSRYDTTLRRAEVQDHGIILFCDNENHRDSDSDPIVEVELRCEGFSLSASGIGLSNDVHDFAKGLLCPLTKPLTATHILWRSASDCQQESIKFRMEGNRLAVFIDPPLGFPTYELEEARYHLENRLSYEREVCSPEETQHLLKDVRGRLTHKGQRNLEQALWGVVESINFIHSQSLRAGMIQAVRKLDRPALVASRPVRDAICLHDIFINPPQDFTQEDYEALTRERQQNEDILILSVQELWSIVIKPVDAAVPYELDVKKFRSFMLHVLALLQYFPARPLTAQKEKDVDYYSLTILDYEVCLGFPLTQRRFTWPELETAFKTENITHLLGFKFDFLPDILTRIPPFEGLCERSCPPPQERWYSGRVDSDIDLSMLCEDFENLPVVPPPPASNHVLIRPSRRYDADRDWVYQEFNKPFTQYTCGTQPVCSIKIAEYNFGHQWFFFMAVIQDENCGTTPCQDLTILQLSQVLPLLPPMVRYPNSRQNPLLSVLRALDRLVQELDSILTGYDEILRGNLRGQLQRFGDLAQRYLAQERPQREVFDGTQLELQLVIDCCNFVRNHLQGNPYLLQHPLSILKRQAEAARRSYAPRVSEDFGLERHTACEFGDDRGSLPFQGNSLEEPFNIPNTAPMHLTSSSRSAQTSAIEGLGLFPCTFGSATKVMLFNECKVISNTVLDWRRHEECQHEQPDQWICSDAACRDAFFHQSIHLEDHLRKDHGKTGDLTEEVSQWHVRRNHQQSFFCPYCDKVILHSLMGAEAIEERSRHLLTHIQTEGSDADMVWVEKEHIRIYPRMEMEIVPNE